MPVKNIEILSLFSISSHILCSNYEVESLRLTHMDLADIR